jgi:hypothetical protein
MALIDVRFPLGVRLSTWRPALLIALAAVASKPVSAGGPLALTADGTPFRWDSSQTVRCVVSSGALGSRTHDTASAMLRQALQAWQQVPGAQLQFELTGEIPRKVNGANVAAFLNGLRGSDPSPILLDDDGSITETLAGQGAADNLLGFSAPYLANPLTGQIAVSFAVINGRLHDNLSDAYLLGTIVHELGHFVNLEHSLVNAQTLFDGDPTNDGLAPQMFYRGPNDPGTLATDDRAWFAWLYPDSSSSGGAIQGRVLLPDGVTGLRGVHVVARRVGDPLVTAVGAVSGYRSHTEFGGASNPAYLGEYLIPNLPPGSYTVEVEPLLDYPSVAIPSAFLVGGKKLWHKGSSPQDAPTDSTLIAVNAGQVVSGIDIVLNGETLGDPKPVQKVGPNALPNAQRVRLPVIISGQIDAGPAESGAGSSSTDPNATRPLSSETALQDVYRVALGDSTIVTAILSAQSAAADLDLYVLHQVSGKWVVEGASTQRGTPPEVVQMRLPPGVHYFGVIRAGIRGSAYTLQLLGSPAPDPTPPPIMAFIGYLLLGNVTKSSADARWITTDDTPSVLYYNQPLQEIGSTRLERQHALTLTGMAPAQRSEVDVYARSDGGVDQVITQLTTATDPAPNGMPRIVATSKTTALDTAGDVVLIESHINNRGDGDAHNVRIGQIVLPAGWYFYWQATTNQTLPPPPDVGDIGAGGAGAFAAVIIRQGGNSDPHITLHGSYTDASGTPMTF